MSKYVKENSVRENIDYEVLWDLTHLNQLTVDEIRQFRNYIIWDQQYNYLRDMWDRWNLKDQAFFKEFRNYIEICIQYWGEFGERTGITHEW